MSGRLKRSYDKDQMTKSVWRFLLTCLLLVALPSQGFAAIGMAVCGPNHHGVFNSVSAVSGLDTRASRDLASQVSHHHAVTSDAHDASGHVDPSEMSSPNTGSSASTSNANSHLKCKNCAPCCASAVVTSEVVTPVARSAGKTDFPAIVTALTFPPLGGLDRPPRLLLA